eukprot:766858-Hanusia_phi.AAC.13
MRLAPSNLLLSSTLSCSVLTCSSSDRLAPLFPISRVRISSMPWANACIDSSSSLSSANVREEQEAGGSRGHRVRWSR